MIDHVDALLKLWRTTSFEWGHRDCLLSIGDYIASRGGKDVAIEYRGRYDTEAEAMAFSDAAGGPCALIDRTGLRRCYEAERPARGDVIVIDVGNRTHVPGVCTGPGYALRAARGVIEIERRFVQLVAAWKVE